MTGRCRYCGKSVTWALSETKGKRMPVEAAADGDLILLPRAPAESAPRAKKVPPPGSGGIEIKTLRYRAHIPVCSGRPKRERRGTEPAGQEKLL